jgi:hypothetical protein
VCIAQIPQRFVTVNDVSPLSAAIRLLTFGAFIPIGSTLAGALMGKGRLPPCYVVLAGAILEIIGVVLLSRIDTSVHVDNAQYGFQVIAGLGTGMINAALILLIPYIMEKRDLGKHPIPPTVAESLTHHSRRISRKFAVPHPWRPRRPLHRGLNLHAVHPLPPDRYRVARARSAASREDRDDQRVSTGYGATGSHALRRRIQPSDQGSDWLCGR